jgi:hypothetical protein
MLPALAAETRGQPVAYKDTAGSDGLRPSVLNPFQADPFLIAGGIIRDVHRRGAYFGLPKQGRTCKKNKISTMAIVSHSAAPLSVIR